jgi:hypothetical protein
MQASKHEMLRHVQVSLLTGLQQLTSLTITDAHISDASGVACLGAFCHLQHLTVQPSVTDTAIGNYPVCRVRQT